ncbi:hypothetical protein DES53_113131 [Roseimicrobium gellanilyticum]|uniref:Uncharacterized protein n=1 Tax=Roseimicrobium gellanilyticum TaxID=748857 RepID=A0A366H6K1_9BACT|nr:hypothetical protein [Roseimicrobium gellanilyticum]RBP37749.1 hypothetical protein DES53_113131 [Roseimicrobium gellanilyticum]
MNCPYCQTPLDRGTVHHARCLLRSEPPPQTQRENGNVIAASFVMRVLQERRASRVIEYRCANGHRVEMTAP